jgi:hypothetical protein
MTKKQNSNVFKIDKAECIAIVCKSDLHTRKIAFLFKI